MAKFFNWTLRCLKTQNFSERDLSNSKSLIFNCIKLLLNLFHVYPIFPTFAFRNKKISDKQIFPLVIVDVVVSELIVHGSTNRTVREGEQVGLACLSSSSYFSQLDFQKVHWEFQDPNKNWQNSPNSDLLLPKRAAPQESEPYRLVSTIKVVLNRSHQGRRFRCVMQVGKLNISATNFTTLTVHCMFLHFF